MADSYRLLSGTHREQDGVKHDAGAVIELTDDQYKRLSHKFEPVAGDEPEEIEPDATVPNDYDVLQEMAMAYDGEEINGRSSREDIRTFLAEQSETFVIDLKYEAGVLDDA